MAFFKPIEKAFAAFDEYNAKDPNHEEWSGKTYPKELLYAMRMTDHLNQYAPNAGEHVQLAARCQHIGRWEISRSSYPMDKKGYIQWRNKLKLHHAGIAENILTKCGYSPEAIEKVKFLVLKKELYQNPETQLLEDVICLVFLEFYFEDFAAKHDDEKLIDILRKTMKKISPKAITTIGSLALSAKTRSLVEQAASQHS